MWFWVLSLGERFRADRIILRPKSTQNFTNVAEKLNLVKKEIATI